MKGIFLALLLWTLALGIQAQPSGIRQIGPDAATGSSLAVVVDEVPLVHTSQLLPLNRKGQVVGKGRLDRQVKQVLDHVSAALKAAGTDTGQLVKLHVYLASAELLPGVQQQLGRYFTGKTKPAVSFVVGGLPQAGALVAMDAIAAAAPSLSREVQYFRAAALHGQLGGAHAALLPATGVVYVSGQAVNGTLAAATQGTMQQLGETLTWLGLNRQQVVQIKAFTRPMADVQLVEKEIARFFEGATLPPVVYVDWLSEKPQIEIELIAAAPAAPPNPAPSLEYLQPPGFVASPVYSKVVRINQGRKVYVSGLYGQSGGDASQEVATLFARLGDILAQAGSDFRHLVKATYYVSNAETSAQLNALRPRYYDPKRAPAASKALVRGVGIPGLGITLDMIGVVSQ